MPKVMIHRSSLSRCPSVRLLIDYWETVSKQEPSTSAFANNKQVRIQESEPEFPSSSADVLDQAESQLLPLQDTGIPTRTPEEDAILSPSIQTSSATRSTSMHEGTTKEVVSRNPNISLTTLAEAGVMPFTLEIAENVQDISSEAFKTEDGSLEEPADMEMPAASQAIEEQYIGDVGNTPLLPYSPEDLWRVAKTGENNASSSHTTVEASKIRRRSSTRSRMSSRPVTRKPSSAPSTAAPADDHAPVPSCCVRSKPSRRQRLVRKSRYVVMCKPFLKLTLGRDLAQSTQMKLRDAALGEL